MTKYSHIHNIDSRFHKRCVKNEENLIFYTHFLHPLGKMRVFSRDWRVFTTGCFLPRSVFTAVVFYHGFSQLYAAAMRDTWPFGACGGPRRFRGYAPLSVSFAATSPLEREEG